MQDLSGWIPPRLPDADCLNGQYVRLELLTVAHADGLHDANCENPAIWTFLPYGPFPDASSYRDWVVGAIAQDDPRFYAIYDKHARRWAGVASLMRISPNAGSIEVGHVNFAQGLQKTRAATEAMFLLMQWVFEAGYRRYEWKCDAANVSSRRAAERFGFSFEGIFRQAGVVKNRNRDTAWFACIDSEWPALKAAYTLWLAPENFDVLGRQRQSLSALTAPILVTRDPG